MSFGTILGARYGRMAAASPRLDNNGAGAFGARPTVEESIMVDGEVDGATYGAIYPTICGSQNGVETDVPSGRIIEQCRIVFVRNQMQHFTTSFC